VTAAVETDATLSRREVTLRSGATACLAGIALVQVIALPPVFSQGAHFAVLAMAAIALCAGLGLALAAAPADAGPELWRRVAAAGVLVLAGWAAPHAFAVPGMIGAQGDWSAMPGGVSGVLAAGCLALAAAAVRPAKGSVRGLLTAGVVVVALAAPVGALLVALGPGTAGGETVLAVGAHAHLRADAQQPEYVTGPDGSGGRLVYRAKAPARQTALGALAAAVAALLFTFGAIDHLRRRSAPAAPVAACGLGSEPA
jgi:hypothetical protein